MLLCWKKFPNLCLASTIDGLKKRENWSLEELREWVAEEAEYQSQASEVKNGVSSASGKNVKWARLYFGTGDKCDRPYKVSNQKHPIWKCEVFKGMENKKKWEKAKKLGLCYRCLGKGHLSGECRWSKECGVDDCKEHHHQILHRSKNLPGSMEGNTDPCNAFNVYWNESMGYENSKGTRTAKNRPSHHPSFSETWSQAFAS